MNYPFKNDYFFKLYKISLDALTQVNVMQVEKTCKVFKLKMKATNFNALEILVFFFAMQIQKPLFSKLGTCKRNQKYNYVFCTGMLTEERQKANIKMYYISMHHYKPYIFLI